MTAERLTIGEILKKAAGYLEGKNIPAPRLDAEVLLAWVLGLDRVHLYVNFDRPLSDAETDRFRELISARSKRIPVAHLRGFKEFFGMRFAVTPEVLIPRPETEILVQEILGWLSRAGFPVRSGAWNAEQARADRSWDRAAEEGTGESLAGTSQPVEEAGERLPVTVPPVAGARILDLATGSGAIAIALASYATTSRVLATDKSASALKIAVTNAQALDVAERVEFRAGDLFAALSDPWERCFDVVVSNPPYIPTAVLKDLEPDVRYEPALALDGGSDGLDFYRRIIPGALPLLKNGGLLALEIGHDQGASVSGLIERTGGYTGVKVVADYGGRDRVVLAVAEGPS